MTFRKSPTLHVIAPARLHLGFVDLNGSLGRKYGSLGLAINWPHTAIFITQAETSSASGKDKDRALKILHSFEGLCSRRSAYTVEIEDAIPSHAGLGSGTQMALAIGSGILRLSDSKDTEEMLLTLAKNFGRGERSGIGLTSFIHGGFILDGGRGSSDRAPPTTVRLPFPETWRILLVSDPHKIGVFGEREKKAFENLPSFSEKTAGHLCRLTLMKLLPSIVEQDLNNFGSALSEIQKIVGEHFSAAQGGTPWSSSAVGKVVSKLEMLGATGLGQSSWGPTGFAFVANDAEAQRLYSLTLEEAKSLGVDLKIVQGRNRGATFEEISLKKSKVEVGR